MKTSAKDGTLEMNKTAKSLQQIAGINIWDDKKNGKIKDTSKILEEVAGKWNKLTDAQKAGLSEAIAGQEQSAVFQSLMKNFDAYNKIVKQFDNGEQFKSMQNENDQFVNSMAGQWNRLKETWIGIWNELGTNQIFAGALKGLNVISDAIGGLVNALSDMHLLQPLVVGLGGFLAFKKAKGLIDTARGLKSINDAIKGLGKSSSVIEAGAALANTGLDKMTSSTKQVSREIKEGGTVIETFKGKLLSLAEKPAFVFGGYAIAAAAGVYAIKKAYDYFNESADEQSKRTSQEVETRRNEVKAYDDQINKLQELQKEYDKLHSKKDKSKDDIQRLKELNNEIAKIKPDLVVSHDKDGNAIIAMTGNVKDLIEQLKIAKNEKKELLQDSLKEDAKSQIRKRQNKKEVGGIEGGSQALGVTNTLNDMQKLEEATIWHKTRMENLEKEKAKAMKKIYTSSGLERKKAVEAFNKANVEMLKEQEKFQSEYNKQLKVVKENSDKLGKTIFEGFENSDRYGTMSDKLKKQFSGLREVLDFSDVQSPEELEKVQSVLSRLMDSARNGDIDLGKLKKSISDANAEFKKTGDVEKYRKTINDLVDTVSKKTGIKNKRVLREIFEGLNEGAAKGKSEIEKFLNAYNKSAADLANNDAFAIALATQQQHIKAGIEGLQNALDSGDLKYKKKILVEISNDKDIPTQVREMIKKLMDSGADTDKTLELAQDVLIDMQDGKIDNIDEFNKKISELTKGKVKFKLNPDMTLSEQSTKAGVETVISQLNERFGEIPTTVKTVIEAEGITAFNQAKQLYNEYKKIPPEIKTDLKNNGLESSKSISLVSGLLNTLPPEVISNIINNFPDAVKNSKTYDELLKNLPPQVATDIIVNSDPTTVEAIKKAIDGLPMNKDVIISVMTGLVSGNIDQINNALNAIPPEKRVTVLSSIENALQGINTVEARKIKDKIAALKADPKLALQGIGKVNGTPMQPKNTKVTETGASNVKGKLNNINNTPNKHHHTQATQNGSQGIIGLLRRILGIPNKRHTTTAINNGGHSVLSNLKSIMAISPTKRIVVTTVFNTIGKAIGAAKKFFTGAGNVVKQRKTTLVNNIKRLNVLSSPSPVPMSTGANTTNPSPTPTGNNSPVPQGATTGAATSSSGISTSQIIPAFNFDIDLLNGMEHELKKIGNELSIIDTKAKRAFGQEKINYLNRQNELYRKQQSLQHELAESMRKQRNSLKSELMRKGIYFDGDRAVNDVSNLLYQEQRVKDLEKRTNADKEGKNEALRKEYDAAKESLDKTKKMLQEYANLTFDKIPACSQEWEKLNSQIKESTVELLKSKYELSNIKVDIQIDKFDNNVKRVNNQISILDKEIENAFGNTKGKLIQNKIELIRSQQDEVRNLSRAYNEQARIQEDLLKNQGFIINQEGQVLNPERLKDFAGSDMYSYLKDQLKSYTDLVNDKIPKLTVDIWNLQGEIKKSYEDQLKVTKEVQDKITEVYKKQIEERKKLIDEEVKSKVDALNKEKDAYNKSRKEMDYKNQLEEQQKTINDLQVDIDNASRDTSISGQKKLQELMDKMKEEQKKLQNLVQEKLDQQVNESFEKEEKRLQEAAEIKKNALDEKYSDKNLIQFANNALKTGVFEDIDGNVKSLQSVISDFVNSTKDGMDALGGVIKRDLVSNLQLAKESFKEMANIYQNIGMGQFYQNTFEVPKSIGADIRSNNKNVSVVFNQPLVVADNITKESLPYLDDMIRQAEKRITENIVKSM